MITVIVNHKVESYDKWLPIFEGHAPVRAKHGISNAKVLRNTKDPNDITLTFHCRSEKDFGEFANSSDLKEIMMKGGVIGMPNIYTYHEAGSYPA